jgi:soluble lytic murein transglycosylase-like protein
LITFLPGKKIPFAKIQLTIAITLFATAAQADIWRSLDPNTPTRWTNVRPTEGRWELYMKEKKVSPAEAAAQELAAREPRIHTVDSRARFASHIQAAAIANNVDAALIRAVITAESSNNPTAVSRTGAVGLMQLMPDTAKRYNVTDSRDPAQNIHGGTRYLSDLMRMFNNRIHLVLAAYNAGEQAVMKYGNRIPPYRETIEYVPKVLKFYRQYSGAAPSVERQSGYKRVASASRKAAAPIRVSRTFASGSNSGAYQNFFTSGENVFAPGRL